MTCHTVPHDSQSVPHCSTDYTSYTTDHTPLSTHHTTHTTDYNPYPADYTSYGNLGSLPPEYYETVNPDTTTYPSPPPPAYTNGQSSISPVKVPSFKKKLAKLASLNPLQKLTIAKPVPEIEMHSLEAGRAGRAPRGRDLNGSRTRLCKVMAILILLIVLSGLMAGGVFLAKYIDKHGAKNLGSFQPETHTVDNHIDFHFAPDAEHDRCMKRHPYIGQFICA